MMVAQERFRARARAEFKRKRMRMSDAEFTQLLTDYGRLAHRLAANGDVVDSGWPARVAILASVVLDARARVEMAAMGTT